MVLNGYRSPEKLTYTGPATLSRAPLAMGALVSAALTGPCSSTAELVLRTCRRAAGVGMPKARPPAKVKNVPDELTMAPSALVARAVNVVPALAPTVRPPRLGTVMTRAPL